MEWQPTPVFLPGESHGQRDLASYSPWGRKELNATKCQTLSLFGTKGNSASRWPLDVSGSVALPWFSSQLTLQVSEVLVLLITWANLLTRISLLERCILWVLSFWRACSLDVSSCFLSVPFDGSCVPTLPSSGSLLEGCHG